MTIARNGYQSSVNRQLPPAVAGDFAGANPRAIVPTPAGGFVTDTAPVYVGRFAFAVPATGKVTNAVAAASLLGFVHRDQQGLITTWLGQDVMTIPGGGQPVTLHSRGDFWAYFAGSAAVPKGSAVYAEAVTGLATLTSGGNTLTAFKTASSLPADAAFTGVIAVTGTVGYLTTSGHSGGALEPGMNLNGTGVAANTFIIEQLSGTPGGAGVYAVSLSKAVSSTAMTAQGGRLVKITTWS